MALFARSRARRICCCGMESHVDALKLEDVFFAQLRVDWAEYLLGRTPFGKTCIQFRMECHCRLYNYYSTSCRLRVCRKVSDIFDELIEENLQEICAKFQENNDFNGIKRALDQLCRGSNNVGRTARSVYRHGHFFDLTEGFHRKLQHDDSTKEGTALTVGDAIRKEAAFRLMPLAVAAYQGRIRACLMSLHARSGQNNIIKRILMHTDLRMAYDGALWKDGAECLDYLHSFCCSSGTTCTLGDCPRMNFDCMPEYFKPYHWTKSTKTKNDELDKVSLLQ